MMRRILVDYARGHNRDKRGSGIVKLPLASADRIAKTQDMDLVELDEALKRFATDYPEESEIVELRFFGGLSIAEAAKVLKVTQPRVSDLVRGRVDLFSIDALVEMLARLGIAVTLRTKSAHRVA